jgi:hypothetical protein
LLGFAVPVLPPPPPTILGFLPTAAVVVVAAAAAAVSATAVQIALLRLFPPVVVVAADHSFVHHGNRRRAGGATALLRTVRQTLGVGRGVTEIVPAGPGPPTAQYPIHVVLLLPAPTALLVVAVLATADGNDAAQRLLVPLGGTERAAAKKKEHEQPHG